MKITPIIIDQEGYYINYAKGVKVSLLIKNKKWDSCLGFVLTESARKKSMWLSY